MFNFRQLAAVERRFLDAETPLLTVVIQQAEGIFAKNDDGYEVGQTLRKHHILLKNLLGD